MNPEESRRRVAAIRINLATGVLLFLASVPTLATQRPELSLNYVGNLITLVMSLISFIGSWISHRYGPTRGSLLFISTLLLVSLGIPLYANGLGLQSGIIVAVIVVSVAATTLPPLLAARVSIVAVIVEAGVILADLYLPDLGIEELKSVYVNPFLILIVLVFAFYVLRQFPSYAFRAKLIVTFVLVAVIAVSAVAIGLNVTGRTELTRQAGLNVNDLADRLSVTIGTNLSTEVTLLQLSATQFEDAALEANESYSGQNKSEILEQINALDARWRESADESKLVRDVVSNDLSDVLREFQQISPQHVELFITDRYGANIAATNRTSDYYQADEDWWQSAYNDGEGGVYLSQPEFDDSSNTYAILMAIPIYHDNVAVGVLRSTLDVTALTVLLEEEKVTEIGHADLRFGTQQLLSDETLTPEEVSGLRQIIGTFGEIPFEGESSLVSEQKVGSPIGGFTGQAITALNWSVIVHQSLDQALLPVENQARATVLISMIVLVLAVIFGYFASQLIVEPIVKLIDVTGRITQGDLNARAAAQTQDEIGALSDSFNQMTIQLQETFKGLEERVAERTNDLDQALTQSEGRARILQSISEISRIISSEQRLDILLPLITRVVSEKFNYYHVGIFLVDDTNRFAVLHAANSEGGQRMLNRGHRLEAGKGIVGNVAVTGQPRIALDVGADAVFFDNPDLPATRSESALPLNMRGRTIGVLDVQSTRSGEFTEESLHTLGVLADQIAIAIENARLFAKNEQTLAEVQSLYNQYLQKEWKALRKKSTNLGYQQSLRGGRLLDEPVESDEIRTVLQKGELLMVEPNGSHSEPAVVVPIKLRGQIIGVMHIKSPGMDRKWSPEEISLIESVSERLALALENARLIEETNRRAEREKLVTEISGKIRSVNDPQAMIRLAVEELKNVLGASHVQVIPQTNVEKQ